ncbi:MAG: LysM peptidoglycan-binding domain-containing protein [Hydrogenophilaceae bacterium]|nr:LysM peptidoglycan-binding domain-containing protein [Hydrogenophilaceae bacterium]
MHLSALSRFGLNKLGLAVLITLCTTGVQAQETDNLAYFSLKYANPYENHQARETSNLWDRLRAGLKLDELNSPLVQVHVDWYAKRPDYLSRMLNRSSRYLFHIVEEVEKRGMPMEIALLPMVESGFNPQAYSRSHAAGIWQFIPSTGKHYGLNQNHWYDGRRDVTAATQAALDYLQKLFLDFGSWELALAAYNCGEGCVSRAIQNNAAKGLPTDYLSLSLPTETRHYVPKLMAFKKLVLEPESFGVELNDIPNEPYFTQVSLNAGAIDVLSAARLAGLSVEEFLSLNPAFPRKVIKAGSDVSVLVPVTHAEIFQTNLEKGEWDSWQPVTAKKGMTPAEIAQQLGTTTANITEHNHLHLKNGRLVKDQVILAPVNGTDIPDLSAASWHEAEEDATAPVSEHHTATYHVVHRGETLSSIARKFRVSTASLKKLNGLKSFKVKAGQRLVVKPASSGNSSTRLASTQKSKFSKGKASGATRYTVRRGDTLFSIASRFNVSVSEIKAWNKLRSSSLPAGKRLTIKRS